MDVEKKAWNEDLKSGLDVIQAVLGLVCTGELSHPPGPLKTGFIRWDDG
jgi:hypothetical protein